MRTLSCVGLGLAAILWALLGPARLVQSDDQATPPADSPGEPKTTDGKAEKTEKDKVDADALTPAPDKQLTALHARFIKDAEKLANQYLKSKQPDRAVAVYKEILKIVPEEPGAKQQMEKLRQYESVADRKTFKVQAKGTGRTPACG